MDLTGRTAIVTGAAGGIGHAISEALGAAGAAVAAWDLDADAADRLADRLTERGHAAIGLGVDVADSQRVRAAVEATSTRLGPPDILVNNAGIDTIERFVDSDEATWRRIIDVNLLGTIICARAVLDGMIERGHGRIINIGSDAGKVGSSGEVVYSATKGAVISFAKALARETATQGIRVNAVCPGPTDTALLDQVAEVSPKVYEGLARAVPVKRIGRPGDIAPLVVFLASDHAEYMTGQAISVSGGLTMS